METKKKTYRKTCQYCEKKFERDEMRHGPDPYNSDIEGDDTEVWLCIECYNTRADEI